VTGFGTCALCGDEIFEADLRDIHDQSVGWFLRRGRGKTGGANSKGKIPHKTGAVAHGHCVDSGHRKHKAGIPFNQGGLF
jgi:hypothetical protein